MAKTKSHRSSALPAAVSGDRAAGLISAAGDLSWIVDNDGVILDALGVASDGHIALKNLVGERWSDTVLPDSKAKVDALLSEVRTRKGPRSREINQPMGDKASPPTPFRFSVAPLDEDRVVAVGRDLSEVSRLQQQMLNAQQASDREYLKMRHAEQRYRLLFQRSSEGVLIADAPTLKVEETNTAASVFFEGIKRLNGRTLDQLVETKSRKTLQALVASAESGGRAEPRPVALKPDGREVLMALSLVRQGTSSHLLVQLTEARGAGSSVDEREHRLLEVLNAMPDAMVVVDGGGEVLCCNASFCELVLQVNEKRVIGQSVGRWLGRSGVEVNVLISNLQSHGTVRNFATVIDSDQGISQPVMVSGVAAEDTHGQFFGLTLRPGENTMGVVHAAEGQPRSVDQLRSLVGQVPLREIVRESADLIEKLCIEAALELTEDNRASAANLLGLSRQGLYSKLRRHSIGDLDSN